MCLNLDPKKGPQMALRVCQIKPPWPVTSFLELDMPCHGSISTKPGVKSPNPGQKWDGRDSGTNGWVETGNPMGRRRTEGMIM